MPPFRPPSPTNDGMSWISGGGGMGALIRSMDWSATPLGPLETWPQSLRTSVSLCLSSTFPILVAWGPDDIQIYNDAYRPICGDLHPQAMGQPFKVVWASAMPVVGDAFERAHQAEGTYIRDQRMFLDRYGYLEEAFMTFSFSPIRDESGEVGGIFHPISESTPTVLNARRSQGLRDLNAAIADARTVDDITRDLAAQYQSMALDLPFVLLYQRDADSGKLVLRGSAGLDAHPALAPTVAELDDACWPFARTEQTRTARQASGLRARLGQAPCGPYDNAPDRAMVLPITVPGQQELYGFVVAGVSAARALDADYLNFYDLLGAAVNTAVGNVVAYEKEQRRAEELAAIDRAKTAFFSNVSHEFRTPLTLILGPLEDALADQAEPLGPVQARRAELTRRNALRLLKLVNSLLDFSRIEAGRVQASYVPLDLARLTADLAGVFESAMERGGLTYRVDVQDLGRPVYVDRDMWEKVVFNLLSNAFKFTLHGGVTVTLAAHDGMARLSVLDTGSGIPPAELPRVFERFHRIEGTPGRTYEGTGIGLALIQELVRLHGGTIAVQSVEGLGTRFDVDLPFGHAHLPADRIVRGAGDSADATGAAPRNGASFVEEALRWLPDEAPLPALRPATADASASVLLPAPIDMPRILIADDNNDMRAYLKSLLDRHANVIVCADGEAAFTLLQREQPDLVLSDVMMPKLDGFGLITKIRADAALRHVPVILLSARAGEEAKVEGLQAGADDYLVKPFAANELLARVKRQLELARERRQHRIELAQRESYFHSLVDVAPVMLWTTEIGGACTYLSKRWYDFTGRDAGHGNGLGWLDNIHPEDMPHVAAAFAEAIAINAPFTADFRLRRHDGAYRWFNGSGLPRMDDGQPDGYVGTVVDIHARTMLRQRLEQVARAGDIGIWYADAPFTHYQVNDQMADQLGLGALRDIPFHSLLDAVAHDHRPRIADGIAASLANGAAMDVEFRSTVGARWLRAIGWCSLNEAGAPVRFDGVMLDISPHKDAERELHRLADELAHKNRMQRDFLFTLAHELRNPLAPMRTGMELMRIQPSAATNVKVQAMMRRQIDHMVHLVDDLLDMARLSEGKLVLRRAPVLMASVVRDAIEISMPVVDAGRHDLTVRLPEPPLTLHVDRHRIAQVVSNLVNNAAKYTPPGGAITVEARIRHNEFVIAVTDNGIGLDAQLLREVFDLYAQARPDHDMSQGGLGVGLNLVKRLVELHGGHVAAFSAGTGLGSCFTVYLPLEAPDPQGDATLVTPLVAHSDGQASQPSEAMRVLVVDDNVDAGQMLGALLDMRGHVVKVVHDGAAALAAAAQFLPHAVFLDIGLPDQSGFDVAPALRRIDGMAEATIVALTGWGAAHDRQRSHDAGFDAHLAKPADLGSVESVLDGVATRIGATR